MNTRLLQEVKTHILDQPKRFIMGRWSVQHTPGKKLKLLWNSQVKDLSRSMPPCGTVACIAGWACLLSGSEEVNSASAERLLGLNRDQSEKLFYVQFWSKHFQRLWHSTHSLRKRAEIAGRVIDKFIGEEERRSSR